MKLLVLGLISTRSQVHSSFQALGRPNADIARGVDTRQELDLRVGVAFSRLLTRSLRNTPLASRKGQKPSITWLAIGCDL